jgi:hypothetical protein
MKKERARREGLNFECLFFETRETTSTTTEIDKTSATLNQKDFFFLYRQKYIYIYIYIEISSNLVERERERFLRT